MFHSSAACSVSFLTNVLHAPSHNGKGPMRPSGAPQDCKTHYYFYLWRPLHPCLYRRPGAGRRVGGTSSSTQARYVLHVLVQHRLGKAIEEAHAHMHANTAGKTACPPKHLGERRLSTYATHATNACTLSRSQQQQIIAIFAIHLRIGARIPPTTPATALFALPLSPPHRCSSTPSSPSMFAPKASASNRSESCLQSISG